MRSPLVLKLLAMAMWFASSCATAGTAPWASSDYVDLYFRIYNGQVPLPHLRDAKQKALFTHLIDPENLLHLQSAGVPQGEKQRQLEIIRASVSALRSRYNVTLSGRARMPRWLSLHKHVELR